MKLVYIVDGNHQYAELMKKLGYEQTDLIGYADLVLFTGGEDVTPALYGDKAHPYTGSNIARDAKEIKVFDFAVEHSIPMVGICRGGQFLNVMNGGRMYQHVEGHCRDHEITDAVTGERLTVTSTHHQMMMPASDAVLVAYSTLGESREWYDKDIPCKDVSDKDIEVVYYGSTNSLCFQPHPEFGGYPEMTNYFNSLLERYLK